MFRKKTFAAVMVAMTAGGNWAQATTAYWDGNDISLGAGPAPTGTWGVHAFWSLDSTGSSTTGVWAPGNDAVFSAGGDATGSFTLTVDGTQTANSVLVEEGSITIPSGAINTGTNAFQINTGASVSIPSSSMLNADGKVVLAGGTRIQTNPTGGAAFINAAKGLEIHGSGTVNYTSSGIGTFSIYTGTILGTGGTTTSGGAGTLIKTGANEFRYQAPAAGGTNTANSTFAKLQVNQGLYRLGSVVVGSQQTTELGFGAAPLLPLSDAITLDGGAIGSNFTVTLHANRGITIGAGGGTLFGSNSVSVVIPGRLSGSGKLTVGGTGTNGNFTLSNVGSATSFTGAVQLDTGFLTLNETLNATNFSGAGGALIIGSSKTFTVGSDNSSTSYTGMVRGKGLFIKNGTGILTINPASEWLADSVTINNGAIKYGLASAGFSDFSSITIGATGTLDMNSFNDSFGGLAGSGSVTNNSGSTGLTLADGFSTTFSGTISGSSKLTISKTGGTQTLAGNNNALVGGVLLKRGGLELGHKNALGLADLIVTPSSATVLPVLSASTTLTGVSAIANNIKINHVTLAGPTVANTLTLGGSNDLELSGVISDAVASAPGAVLVSGAGTLTLTGNNTYTGATTVNAGRLRFANNANVTGVASTPSLTVNGGTFELANTGGATSTVLDIPTTIAGATDAWVGTVDLQDNDMIARYTAGQGVAKLAEVTNQIKSGLNINAAVPWTGTGITSTEASLPANQFLTALGVISNDLAINGLGGTGAFVTSFAGRPVDENAVLVKYTWFGDANLDGVVDDTDYSLIDNGFGNSLTGWVNGDFNYDGTIDDTDYSLIDGAFGNQNGQLLTAEFLAMREAQFGEAYVANLLAAVPEPTSLGLLAVGAMGMLARRRRQA